jgi:hypothetical protein
VPHDKDQAGVTCSSVGGGGADDIPHGGVWEGNVKRPHWGPNGIAEEASRSASWSPLGRLFVKVCQLC